MGRICPDRLGFIGESVRQIRLCAAAHSVAEYLRDLPRPVVKKQGGGKPQVLPVVRPGRQVIDGYSVEIPIRVHPVRRGEGDNLPHGGGVPAVQGLYWVRVNSSSQVRT